MKHFDLIAWRNKEGFNKGRAAQQLEVSRTTYHRWEAGLTPIPPLVKKYIGLRLFLMGLQEAHRVKIAHSLSKY